MSLVQYYLSCVAAGLLLAAAASSFVVQHVRSRELRRRRAVQLLVTLDRYTEWVSAQREALFFQSAAQDGGHWLQEIGGLQQRYFPDLWAQAQDLFAVHSRLLQFQQTQHRLRIEDTEAWFDSDPDAGFVVLWRDHRCAARTMEQHLAPIARRPGTVPRTMAPEASPRRADGRSAAYSSGTTRG